MSDFTPTKKLSSSDGRSLFSLLAFEKMEQFNRILNNVKVKACLLKMSNEMKERRLIKVSSIFLM
jgi:hypothetical protein